MINPYIFREYDIRGVVDKDLSDEVVENIGKGFSAYIANQGAKSVSVGGDVRLSTNRFLKQLIKGITESGIDVINIGQVPTPVQYFSMHELDVDAGIMITGSHNPPEFNGFKLSLFNSPVFGTEIQKIKEIIQNAHFISGNGSYQELDIKEKYKKYLLSNINIKKRLKVVIDSGNGAGSLVAHKLFKEFGVDTIDIFDTPDGNFPNHHPDPTVEKNIQELIKTVIKTKADVGIGYDGDADRIGVVDENGKIVWGDKLMILFSREIIKNNPNANIIFEVKCSQALPEMIEKFGGKPIMWKTGHSILKKKMKELNSPLAGEMSGHLFFADRYFGYDDAIYASARLVELLSNTDKKLSELLSDVPKYYATPEIRVETESDEIKFEIAQKAKKYFSENYDVIDVDGVRILFDDGWGLVRASNTQPVLVLRFEARSQERLNELKSLVINKLKEFGNINVT